MTIYRRKSRAGPSAPKVRAALPPNRPCPTTLFSVAGTGREGCRGRGEAHGASLRTPDWRPCRMTRYKWTQRVASATGALVMPNAFAESATRLESLLRLRSIPFAMKLFANRAEMEAIPRIRRPTSVHTLDQVVAQAARLGWTVGITAEDLVGAQCRAVVGLGHAKDAAWRSGKHMTGVWFSTPADAGAHQAAMHCVADGRFEALAVAPLAAGRLDPPDIALFYATPGAMMYCINGLQWSGYRRFDWSIVGESACADSWGRALTLRQPSLSIPCFAERRYGGVLDDEMLMALPPEFLSKAIAGMEALAKNGFRYPFPQYGIQQDVRAGMAKSYPDRGAASSR